METVVLVIAVTSFC